MLSIYAAVIDLKQLDLLAERDSPIHALDARAKVLVTLVFIMSVVSFDRYELARLLPFFIFPVTMIARADLPPRYFAQKTAFISLVVIMVGIFNPVFDRTVLYQIGELGISGGWVSLASLCIRSFLTIGAAFILIGTTGFTAVCQALESLGVPQLFAVQLLFLHRYLFVLADEAGRTSRARELRSCGKKGMGVASFSSLAGHLILRTWQRAERIHTAMLSRGFTGRFYTHRQANFGTSELCFLAIWSLLFISLRICDISTTVRAFSTGIYP